MAIAWGGEGLLQWYGYDSHKMEYLVKGFMEVFHMRLDTSVEPIVADISGSKSRSKSNHKSARLNAKAVEDKLHKNSRRRELLAPF